MSINKYKVNNIAGVPYSYSIFERFFKKNIPKSLKYTTQAGGKMNNKLIKNLLQIYKKIKLINSNVWCSRGYGKNVLSKI